MQSHDWKLLKYRFLKDLGERLRFCGFKPAREQSFSSRSTGLNRFLHIGFIQHNDDFDIMADIAIRFEAVEKLVTAGNRFLSSREKAESCTLGCYLGDSGRGGRWTVTGDLDLAHAVEGVMEAFISEGIPFFDRYPNAQSVLPILASDDRSASRFALPYARAERAIAVAFLMRDRDLLQDLLERKREYLASIGDNRDSDLRRFAEHLLSQLPDGAN